MNRRKALQLCSPLILMAAAATGSPPPLASGEPVLEGNLPESATRVFIPHDETSREVRIASMIRRVEAATGGPLPGNPTAANELSGIRLYPVILVEFANRPHDFDADAYRNMIFGDPDEAVTAGESRPTLTQYFRDMSGDRFTAKGKVYGWYTLSKNDAYYENNRDRNDDGELRNEDDNSNGRIDAREKEVFNGSGKPFGELLTEAFRLADEDVDFRDYDNNDDGRVDGVFLVHSEAGAEADHDADDVRLNIWSHAYTYKTASYGHDTPYVTNDPLLDDDGQPREDANGDPMFVVIDNYIIQPAVTVPKRETEAAKMIPVGVFCHEFAHLIGLPDLYDRTPAEQPDSSGVGNWCLMAHGNYGGDDEHADRPVSLSAWCKERLGWANIRRVTQNQQPIEFQPVAVGNEILRFDVPGTNGDEYFLVEYRCNGVDRIGGRINWDRDLPCEGLAIWHADNRVGRDNNPQWPIAYAGQGQNDFASRPADMLPGYTQPHALVRLVQADGEMHLESAANNADAGDLFGHLATFEDDARFRKGTQGYDGQHTGIRLLDINLVDKTLTARLDATAASGASAPMARREGAPPSSAEAEAPAEDVRPAAPPAVRPTVRPAAPSAERPAAPPAERTTRRRDERPNRSRANPSVSRPSGAELQAISPSLNSADRAAVQDLQTINSKLQATPQEPRLSPNEVEQLKGASRRELRLTFDEKTLPTAKKISATARTEKLKSDTPAEREIGRKVQEAFLKSDGDTATVRVRAVGQVGRETFGT